MKIVKRRLFFVLLVLVQSSVFAQTDRIGPAFELKPHPRILMFASDEAAIKTTIAADKTWSRLQEAIFSECDRLLTLSPVERIQIGRRLLDKSREALRR